MTSTFGCPHCGRSNPIDARFCAFCGTDLQEVDRDWLTPAEEPDPPEENASDRLQAQAPDPSRRSERRDQASADDSLERDRAEPSQPPPPDQAQPPLQQPELGADTERAADSPAGGAGSAQPSPEFPDRAEREALFFSDLPGSIRPADPPQIRDSAAAEHLPGAQVDDGTRRQLRHLFGEEVPLADIPPPGGVRPPGRALWRRTWIYWLLLGLLLLALFFADETPEATPHVWPGVEQAFAAVEALPEGAVVLVDWAYDPATAGEMDLVARPVIEHLLAQEVRFVIISQIPTGPATARRLIAMASADVRPQELLRRFDATVIEGGFLPGGVATLPLLGQAPLLGVPVDLQGRPARARPALAALATEPPALTLVVAARAESVQRWLEQVQPLNDVPTLAVTSAAADPPLRPYVDSGQLVGLVSGYSGGLGYRDLLLRPMEQTELAVFGRQINGHTWALVALLVVVVLGNLTPSERNDERRDE